MIKQPKNLATPHQKSNGPPLTRFTEFSDAFVLVSQFLTHDCK